ncbi:hypothetical protein GPAL_0387 [Glaciecola pallidula DSM 14239 = ACAM 615]|uniref:Uncharacterized protein n=1 Tax=Brumicola pallidula DSM 14239 = ACAM 615 TaxID=1121922 RepID=K6ZA71_9ALTE|nr:hypothetical protein GPAL_0387 [Glaciecola pallidula DSM 14239 = ACAM 615]
MKFQCSNGNICLVLASSLAAWPWSNKDANSELSLENELLLRISNARN